MEHIVVELKPVMHPTRIRILEVLDQGSTTPAAFARRQETKPELVAYHFRMLCAGWYIDLTRTKQIRGTLEHHYELRTRGETVLRWLRLIQDEETR